MIFKNICTSTCPSTYLNVHRLVDFLAETFRGLSWMVRSKDSDIACRLVVPVMKFTTGRAARISNNVP